MSDYYTTSALWHLGDGSQYAQGEGLREFIERTRERHRMPDAPATVWTRSALGSSPDWPPARVPLLSSRMATVVREHLGEADHVEWLPAFVVSGDGIREDF